MMKIITTRGLTKKRLTDKTDRFENWQYIGANNKKLGLPESPFYTKYKACNMNHDRFKLALWREINSLQETGDHTSWAADLFLFPADITLVCSCTGSDRCHGTILQAVLNFLQSAVYDTKTFILMDRKDYNFLYPLHQIGVN